MKHSFSKEIHGKLADYEYEIKEIPKDGLDAFMRSRDFLGINVTIPYKELVIPYLDVIDASAKAIGAVNTVVNKGGKLFGYNTDFYGMCELFRHAGINPRGKRAAVLGTGGTSKTARAVLEALGAAEILSVSRTKSENCISYGELYESFSDTEIIVNTTPVGMFPNTENSPVFTERLPKLSGVIDAVYNPIRTELVLSALAGGIKAEGGLYMLVAQAVRASELFLEAAYPEGTLDKVYEEILASKENIVLIGMPSSGKSTLGKILSTVTGRDFFDTDSMVKENSGMEISDIFEKHGETYFRELETEAVRSAADKNSVIIATGGGAVLNRKNIKALQRNGRLVFLDRELSELIPTDDRPLSKDRAALEKRYFERLPIYRAAADFTVKVTGEPEALAEKIKELVKL